MANTDSPNGFRPVYRTDGGTLTCLYFPIASSQTLAAGDAVYLASGLVTIATSSTGTLLGVIAQPCSGLAANTMVPVYVFDSATVFEGQCSGTFALSIIGTSVDIEGTTGIMEVNENATTEQVIRIVGFNPNTEIGANSRVWFVGNRSEFNGYTAAA